MTEAPFSPFDNFGKVKDLSKKLLATLPATQRDAAITLLDTAQKLNAAEAVKISSEREVRNAIDVAHNTRQAFYKLQPKATFLSEHKRVIAANEGRVLVEVLDPVIVARAEEAAKAADDADAALEQRRQDAENSRKNLAQCRHNYSLATMAWSRVDGAPKSPADLMRAASKAEREAALEAIANPKPLPPSAPPRKVWDIEKKIQTTGVKRPQYAPMKAR